MKNPMLYVFVLFVLIGIGILVALVRGTQQDNAFFATAEQDTATIKDYVPDPNPKAADFCPEYEFTTRAGQLISFVGDNCPSQPDYSQIGQTEQIYIDPAQPQIVRTRDTSNPIGGWLIGAVAVLFFPFLGLMMFVRSIRSDGNKVEQTKRNAGQADSDAAELQELQREEAQLKNRMKERGS